MEYLEAAKTGNLAWFKRQELIELSEALHAFRMAAAHGHLDAVKWLVMESKHEIDVTHAENYALNLAAQNGHLAIVRWLVIDYNIFVEKKKLRDPGTVLEYLDVTTFNNRHKNAMAVEFISKVFNLYEIYGKDFVAVARTLAELETTGSIHKIAKARRI